MKKIHLLLFVGLLSATIANAGRVTEQEALQKAQQFMKGKVMRPVMSRSLTRVQSVKEDCAFYIFNAEDQGGYVIISADDRTDAVLGYSDTGAIDIDNMPENLRWWLLGYAEQIKAMSNDMPLTKTRTTRGTMSAISPLIQTKWDQYKPYNLQCPEYEMEKCVTGCTSTALAQVMYYHKWPTSCPAIPAYVTKSLKISLPELPATSFKWDLMKTSYDYSAVGDAENAVAELLRYCGQANEIDYTTTGSAASLKINVMINTFGYSKNMRSLYRGNYTDSHWESLIYEELSNQRPVLYCGNADPDSSIKEGHQFICDGYDGNGKFHINWGWGGRCDGYYLLSACNPEDEGKPNGFKFNIDQLAITGFKPAKEGEVEIPSMRGDTWDYIIQAYTRSSVEEDFEDVSITGRITANYNINPTSSFTTEVGWGLYQGEDMIKTFSSGPQTFEAKNQSSVKNETLISFGKGLTDGTYQLRQLYKDPETDSWCLCLGYLVESLIVEINGTSMIIKRFDMGSVKFTVNNMSCSEVPSVDVPVTVTADITNQGNSSNFVVCLWYQKEGETTWHNSASRVLYIDKDNTFPAEMQFTPKDAGNYNLKLTSNYSEEALATLQIVVSATENVVVDGVTYFCSPAYNSAKIVVAEKDALPRELVIPSTVTTSEGIECRVQSIDEYVFLRMNTITRLTISEGVKTIGRYAFMDCYNLKRIELPASLTSIGEQAFSYCERVVAVISKVKKPFNIEESVFASGVNYNPEKGEYDCSPSTATLYVPIGSLSAYQEIKGWTNFAKMEEGEPFETIQDGLKYLCSSYSRTATVIDGDYKELENVEIPAEISVDEVPYKVTTVGNSAFCNKRNIRSLTLPEGLETIGDYAFYKIGISELTLPSTLRSIGAWSFNSSNITTLAIPEGVESIGKFAFRDCYYLESLELPSSLTDIGEYVISGCDALSSVVSNNRNPKGTNENAFMNLRYDREEQIWFDELPQATLYVPLGCKPKYLETEGWAKFADIQELDGETVSITIGNNGKTTYCGDMALDFSYSDEVKAFIATGFDKTEGTIWMTRVKDVPAGVPVMIKGTANETYHVPVTEGGSSYYKNMFVGNTSGEIMSIGETSEDGKYVNYYMSGGQFKSVKTSANIGTNKCYLQLPATFEAEATGDGCQVKIAASGKSSFAAPCDLDFTSLNDDVKAFTATGYDASTKTIWLTRVRKVQKGEGLLLKGTGGETYTIPSAGVQAAYENMIVGNIGDEITINGTSEDGTLTNYYLKGGTYVSVSGSANIGTNKSYLQLPTPMLAGTTGARSEDAPYSSDVLGDLDTLGYLGNLGMPSTCHLAELETESMPIVFGSIGGDDETTGIKDNNRETITNNRDDQWFTLGGQRIDKPTKKGLYIHNGRKVVIR